MSIIDIVEGATECIAGKARHNGKRTTGRPEGHDVKVFLDNYITFGQMWGIIRRRKRAGKRKATNRNKHRTFTSALQDARIQRAQRRKREWRNDNENQEKRRNDAKNRQRV